MKQHISLQDLNELSEKGKERLDAWIEIKTDRGEGYIGTGVCNECGNKLTLNIGQLIELLGNDYWRVIADDWKNDKYVGIEWGTGIDDFKSPKPEELCDALWEPVKQILEQEER